MTFLKHCAPIVALVLSVGPAAGVEPKRKEVLLLQNKPAGLLRLQLPAGVIQSTIPLEKNADYAVVHPKEPFVYVIHRRALDFSRGTSYLSVVDLTKNTTIRYLPCGNGASDIVFSEDGGRAFVFARGLWMKKGQKTAKAENAASVLVLNTRSNDIEVVYRSDKGADEFLASPNGKRVFLLSSGTRLPGVGSALAAGLSMGVLMGKMVPKQVAQELAVFGGTSSSPLKSHLLSSHVENIVLSRDQGRLIMAGKVLDGGQKGQGALQTLDVETAELTAPKTIGREPRRLFRFEDRDGIWLAGKEEMRLISENGDLNENPIRLQWDAEAGADGKRTNVEGYPGQTVELAGGRAAIQIIDRAGLDKKKLALVDTNGKRLLEVVPVGNKGVRTRRKIGAFALAAGLSIAAGSAAYGMGSPYTMVFYPTSTARLGSVAKRPDGEFCYALDPESDDLTVIRASDGKVTGHIPFSVSHTLWAPPGSRYILGLGGNEVEVADTESHTYLGKTRVASGGIAITAIDGDTGELYVMGSKGIEVWNGASGKPVGHYSGFKYRSVVQLLLPPTR